MRYNISHKVAACIAGACVAFSMSAPAMAGSWTHTSMGGKVTVSAKTIKLKDNAADNKFVTTEFKYNSGQSNKSLANKLGYGTTTSASVSSNITNDKICRSNPAPLPVDCGSWKH